jgi:hypothetical protein
VVISAGVIANRFIPSGAPVREGGLPSERSREPIAAQ